MHYAMVNQSNVKISHRKYINSGMTRVTCKIKDVISEVKSGDWGKGSPTENYTTEVLCVRGADIPELCKGNVGKMPQRFIHNKKATSKILSANNLIIEISGRESNAVNGAHCANIR